MPYTRSGVGGQWADLVAELRANGKAVLPEAMLPLIATKAEFDRFKEMVVRVSGVDVAYDRRGRSGMASVQDARNPLKGNALALRPGNSSCCRSETLSRPRLV